MLLQERRARLNESINNLDGALANLPRGIVIILSVLDTIAIIIPAVVFLVVHLIIVVVIITGIVRIISDAFLNKLVEDRHAILCLEGAAANEVLDRAETGLGNFVVDLNTLSVLETNWVHLQHVHKAGVVSHHL